MNPSSPTSTAPGHSTAVPAAGWHPDPTGGFALRWWDGQAWTDNVHGVDGNTALDPISPNGDRPSAGFPVTPDAVYPQGAHPHIVQTPNFNLPGGGAWAAPQQLVVSNASKSPGLAVGSLVLGVGAFFFALIPVFGLTSIPFAITGLALGIAGWMRANKGFEGKGLSTAGIVASVAALLVSAVYLLAIGEGVNDAQDDGIYGASGFVVDADQ
jgi:hypothetical protein